MRESVIPFTLVNSNPNPSVAQSTLNTNKRSVSHSTEDIGKQGPSKRAASMEALLNSRAVLQQQMTMPTFVNGHRDSHRHNGEQGLGSVGSCGSLASIESIGSVESEGAKPARILSEVSFVEDALAEFGRLAVGNQEIADPISRGPTPTPLGESRPESPFPSSMDLIDTAAYGVVGIMPEELVNALRYQEGRSDSDQEPIPPLPFPHDAAILPVDLRDVADFARCSIRGSVNVNLPVLMLKRFRRGTVSSFQMSNFLTGPESRELYEKWKRAREGTGQQNRETPVDSVLVIYDDEMPEDHKNTEAWALVHILAKGLAEDLSAGMRKSSSATASTSSLTTGLGRTIITYLRGGFKGFQELATAESFLCISNETERSDSVQEVHDPVAIRAPQRSLSASPAPGNGISSPSPSLHIRTNLAGNLVLPQHLASPISTHSSSPPDSGTPKSARPAGLIADSTRQQRKKSAFSINTTKLTPQSRSRGHTVTAAGAHRLSQLPATVVASPIVGTPPLLTAAVLNKPAAATANDSIPLIKAVSVPPMSRQSSNPLPRTEEAFPPASAHPNAAHSGLPNHRRSISDSRSSTNSSTTSQHTVNPYTFSPGPSTLPTPVEPVSEVLPYLLLGSDAIPQSADAVNQLKALGVTHVLNMAVEVENKAVDDSGEFRVKWCLAEDHAEHEIEHAVMEAVDWIAEAHRSSPTNKVFVHCKAGRSRSATTVIAYLVVHHGMKLREAYEKVKEARPGVSPNLGFMLALLRIEREVHGETSNIVDYAS